MSETNERASAESKELLLEKENGREKVGDVDPTQCYESPKSTSVEDGFSFSTDLQMALQSSMEVWVPKVSLEKGESNDKNLLLQPKHLISDLKQMPAIEEDRLAREVLNIDFPDHNSDCKSLSVNMKCEVKLPRKDETFLEGKNVNMKGPGFKGSQDEKTTLLTCEGPENSPEVHNKEINWVVFKTPPEFNQINNLKRPKNRKPGSPMVGCNEN